MKLNGWQRLWIVLAVLWVIPVAVIAYTTWPTTGTVPQGDVYARLLPATLRVLVDPTDSLAAQYGVTPAPPVGADVTEWLARHAPENRGVTARIDDQHTVQFMKGTSQADMERSADEYYRTLRRLLTGRRDTFLAQALAVWIVPLVSLYALGWAVGWIRRGFGAGARGRI